MLYSIPSIVGVSAFEELLVHAAVASPVAVLTAAAAVLIRSGALRAVAVALGVVLFPVVFLGSYAVFCMGCD